MVEQSATAVLLEYSRDKISVIDADGTFTYVSGAAKQILGFDPETLVGTVAWEYIHPEDRSEVVSAFERVINEPGFSEITQTYRHEGAGGDWVWLESRMSNLTDEAIDGYVISSRDVTDRVEVEQERQEMELRLQHIAARTSEVLWLFDADWEELLFCNEAYEAVYGTTVEELEDDPSTLLECIHPKDRPAVAEAMDQLSMGESVDMEYRVNPAIDYGNWVWVQGEPICEDGEVVRIAGFTRDITDRRRRERQLAVLDTLLRHNLRNDMNAIISNAELIEEYPDDQPAEKAAVIRRVGENLVETAEKQREIITLLKEPVSTRPVNLRTVTTSAVRSLTDRYPEATIQTDLQPVEAEALEQTELAILELLENALCHAETPDPTVRVTTRRVGDTAEVTVSDNCPPIPDHEYRVLTGEHEMTATYHSSGLGLWLVYWIVDLAGGDIDFRRRDDGNVVTIRLPGIRSE